MTKRPVFHRAAARLSIERKKRLNRMFSFWRGEAKARGFKPADVGLAVCQARKAT